MSDTAHGITTGAVARHLGVSPTTLRSWDQRYGIGPAAREGGRHRRWAPEDVAMLEEMCRLTASGVPPAEAARAARTARTAGTAARAGVAPPVGARPAPRSGEGPQARTANPVADTAAGTGAAADTAADTGQNPAPYPISSPYSIPSPYPREREPRRPREPGPDSPAPRPAPDDGPPVGDARRERRGLSRAAVRLDGPALTSLLRGVVAEHGLVTAWEEVMVPTLHAVGRKWESSGDRYVEVEHLLSWHVSTALRQVAPAVPRSLAAPAPPVLLACVPAEQHTLPLEALAAGLAERGLPARMFGGAVPAEALDAAVRRTGPAAVVLWSQARSTANHALARHVVSTSFGVRGARTHPLVLLAGPGWAGRAVRPGMRRPGGLREALDVLASLYAEPSASTATGS
ncbi:MerR family transcriptional regulator [Streptomyces sp. NPDC059352]|uniref:MerR family transcriptional regulator n=1 Tax=Streptomyces sp. NPDC059352 TaxID=3346810 RepID=UPI00368462F2